MCSVFGYPVAYLAFGQREDEKVRCIVAFRKETNNLWPLPFVLFPAFTVQSIWARLLPLESNFICRVSL